MDDGHNSPKTILWFDKLKYIRGMYILILHISKLCYIFVLFNLNVTREGMPYITKSKNQIFIYKLSIEKLLKQASR